MRVILALLFTILLVSCRTQRGTYKAPDFSEKTGRHRTIAILPVRFVHTGHRPRGVTDAQLREANEKLGYIFQESLYAYVLRETGRNRKGPVVSFQALHKTNALLKENGLDIYAAYDRQPEALARLLGVDAVMATTMDQNKNFSDGVAYGLAAGRILLSTVGNSPLYMPWVNASDLSLNAYLYDARDSKVLWKAYRHGGTDLPASIDRMVQYYSSWVARKLPYRS